MGFSVSPETNKYRIIKENLSLTLTYWDLRRCSASTNSDDNKYGGAIVVAGYITETLSELLNKQRLGRRGH